MLHAINLRSGAGQDWLGIYPKRKRTVMKSDRASFQIVHKLFLNTSGATKDQSMTERMPPTGKLEGAQTGGVPV